MARRSSFAASFIVTVASAGMAFSDAGQALADRPPDTAFVDADERFPANPPRRFTGRIEQLDEYKGKVIITIDRGTDDLIKRGDRGRVLDADGHPIEGSEFTIVKATKDESFAKVSLSMEILDANRDVELRYTY